MKLGITKLRLENKEQREEMTFFRHGQQYELGLKTSEMTRFAMNER